MMNAGMVRVMPDTVLLKEYRLNVAGFCYEYNDPIPNQKHIILLCAERILLEAEILRRMKHE